MTPVLNYSVRWQRYSQNWGALERDWTCEADPQAGGRQLRHANGDGAEAAECIFRSTVRSYGDPSRAPKGSWVEMCIGVMSGFWDTVRTAEEEESKY